MQRTISFAGCWLPSIVSNNSTHIKQALNGLRIKCQTLNKDHKKSGNNQSNSQRNGQQKQLGDTTQPLKIQSPDLGQACTEHGWVKPFCVLNTLSTSWVIGQNKPEDPRNLYRSPDHIGNLC